MPLVVTGAAGFIGSTLCSALLADGQRVRALDRRHPATDPIAAANLAAVVDHPGFELVTADLLEVDLADLFDGARAVVHLAGQPGVQTSWGDGFAAHVEGNVLGSQVAMEAARRAGVPRFVLASSSSVYGDVARGGAREGAPVSPRSPYGVSKAAAEQLAGVYAERGLPVVALRYFTVYGPRQRPDMALHRIVAAAQGGDAFVRRGDGKQRRELTYVDDVVQATIAAAQADLPPGWIGNVGGGASTSLNALIALVEELGGRPVPIEPSPALPGDPARTAADLRRTTSALGWSPRTSLREGVARQIEWQASVRALLVSP
jgi:nucleoside-diphosphate-sugar epimerase